jgi:hypothetical protein
MSHVSELPVVLPYHVNTAYNSASVCSSLMSNAVRPSAPSCLRVGGMLGSYLDAKFPSLGQPPVD